MISYESGLSHQIKAVNACVGVLEDAQWEWVKGELALMANPLLIKRDEGRLEAICKENGLESIPRHKENIFDICMETGTGKTYTYAKMAVELKKKYGLRKFVILVPGVAIKLQSLAFLKSEGAREHFRLQGGYEGVEIKAFSLDSKKSSGKNKKQNEYFPQGLKEFVEDESKDLCFLVVNIQMLMSETMKRNYEHGLFDRLNQPYEALKALNAVWIMDEPHKFNEQNKTWSFLQEKLQPQILFRYGATFADAQNDGFYNLIYRLDSITAFNDNLIKGVVAYTLETRGDKKENLKLKLCEVNNYEARFELRGVAQKFVIGKGEDMGNIHESMRGIICESMRKGHELSLSNGQIFKVGERFCPFSYERELAITMMREAIKKHFELEKELLSQSPRIKPLSLFFIDDIAGYRARNDQEDADLWIREKFESMLKEEILEALEHCTDEWYKTYLHKSLENLSMCHGGYFSMDTQIKDEKIGQEVSEILRDKEALLALENPRRFIFSKWTLKEGWDNPNIFVICKMRGSGSEISKLQEVGRGLRLPLNEYFSRVKDRQFYLHYFVDFSEQDFVERLCGEIQQRSWGFDEDEKKLSEVMIQRICGIYKIDEDSLLNTLGDLGIIKHSREFKEGGFYQLKEEYPKAFDGLRKGKVVKSNEHKKPKITIKKDLYEKLRTLWEAINQKVVLEYRIDTEERMRELLRKYLEKTFLESEVLQKIEIVMRREKIVTDDGIQTQHQGNKVLMQNAKMSYGRFVGMLAQGLKMRLDTLHDLFTDLQSDGIDIGHYMSEKNARVIRQGFNEFLLEYSDCQEVVKYHPLKTSASVHPTDFTYEDGRVRDALEDSKISLLGAKDGDDLRSGDPKKPLESYLLSDLRFDSCLEWRNITEEYVQEVLVFTKIPKKSIQIPIPGGGSYSPDFLYVMDNEIGCVIETKGKSENELFVGEERKIAFAQKFFKVLGKYNVHFCVQFEGQKIEKILTEIIESKQKS